jgi:hypothetical protein
MAYNYEFRLDIYILISTESSLYDPIYHCCHLPTNHLTLSSLLFLILLLTLARKGAAARRAQSKVKRINDTLNHVKIRL